LIVDEALAVGDAYFIHRCMNRIQELKKAGKTIILVTHDATAVRHLCTSVIWMDHGKIKEIGPTEHIIDKYLADIFLIQKESTETQQRTEIDQATNVFSKLNPEGRLTFDARYGDRTCEIIEISVSNLEGKSWVGVKGLMTIDSKTHLLIQPMFLVSLNKSGSRYVPTLLKTISGVGK
jgi:ABC-type glutathione transport system ATPase component